MRRLVAVWIFSIALASAALASLTLSDQSDIAQGLVLPPVPVVVIGSSLLRHGVPPTGGPEQSLLADGRPHIRLAASNLSEAQALQLAKLALQSGAKTILIEIFPFCRDFAHKKITNLTPDRLPRRWSRIVLAQSEVALDAFTGTVLGHNSPARRLAKLMKKSPFTEKREREKVDLSALYPLNLRESVMADDLTQFLGKAKSNGVAVYFLAPPRSEIAAEFQGPAAVAALDRHVKAVAQRFGVDLIDIGPVWPDSFFVDQGHLNLAGQERLIRDLRVAWAKRHGA